MEAVLKSLESLPAEQKVAILSSLLLQAKPAAKEEAKEEVAKPAEEGAKKAKKAKKEKDPDAPKKEGSWWAKASADASKKLKEEGLVLKDIKLLVPEFCSLLAMKEYITKEKNASVEEIKEVFNFCKENPGVAKESLAAHKEQKSAAKPAPKKEKKEVAQASPADKKEEGSPADKKEEVVEEGFFVFEGKKYRTSEGTPEEGCFLWDGEECAGFYFQGELDRETKM
jgi:hypothetical protein